MSDSQNSTDALEQALTQLHEAFIKGLAFGLSIGTFIGLLLSRLP